MLQPETLQDALNALGTLLEDRGSPYSLAIIGGGALLLRGVLQRPTKDIDVVGIVEQNHLTTAEPLPAALVTAALDVGMALDLPADWLNSGPTSVLELGLPTWLGS